MKHATKGKSRQQLLESMGPYCNPSGCRGVFSAITLCSKQQRSRFLEIKLANLKLSTKLAYSYKISITRGQPLQAAEQHNQESGYDEYNKTNITKSSNDMMASEQI